MSSRYSLDMRAVIITSFLALSLVACGRANPELTDGGGSDAHPGVGGNGGSGGSGGSQGGKGATCTTACDCTPGLGCSNGQCGAGTAVAYYCCEDTTACPQNSACQDSAGNVSTCGAMSGNGGSGGSGGGGTGGSGGGGGGFPGLPDGGLNAVCGFIPCSSDAICTQFMCGSCNTSTMKCN